MKSVDRLRKYAEGGRVRKYLNSGKLSDVEVLLDEVEVTAAYTPPKRNVGTFNTSIDAEPIDPTRVLSALKILGPTNITDLEKEELAKIEARRAKRQARHQNFIQGFGGEDAFSKENWKGTAMQMGGAAIDMVDDALVGDKNFGAQSEAIDGAVDMASEALMKSGNPYAVGAALALKGANFLTKAGGQTVQGFDIDINSSGYGDLGHMESSSSRDFGAMIGLGGLNQGKIQAKLAKRNQQAMMAMNAANIANEQSFEQEARMNSIQNTIMNNNIALAGGLETNLLGG